MSPSLRTESTISLLIEEIKTVESKFLREVTKRRREDPNDDLSYRALPPAPEKLVHLWTVLADAMEEESSEDGMERAAAARAVLASQNVLHLTTNRALALYGKSSHYYRITVEKLDRH